jgi:catechol 2,3-dioxygenase-like lactoylglutathione lyase family enzyme
METRVHVSIEVSDLDQAVQFYSRLFQAEPTKRRSDYANFRLETPQLHLALVHNPKRTAEPQSNRHYGIELFADAKLASWRQAVESSGLKLRIEEQTTCCYAVADKFWARDPDGHEWEFWVRHAEAETMHEVPATVSSSNASACCAPLPEPVVKKEDYKAGTSACCAPGDC